MPMAYLFTCPIPAEDLGKVPKIVTIVAKPCDLATNALRVQHAKQAKKLLAKEKNDNNSDDLSLIHI